jgi:hypothetical protein
MGCAPNERIERRVHARASRHHFTDVARHEPSLPRPNARVLAGFELMGRVAHTTHTLRVFSCEIREQPMRAQCGYMRSNSESTDAFFEGRIDAGVSSDIRITECSLGHGPWSIGPSRDELHA